MKVLSMIWVFVLLLVLMPTLGFAFTTSFNADELLVKYTLGTQPAIAKGKLEKIGWKRIKLDSDKDISREMIILQENSNIISVEPNYYGEFLSMPNDPYFDDQWYLPNVNVPEAWDISLGSGVVIGLIDSGVDLMHQDLADNVLPDGWDFADNDADPSDGLGHGTAVCGIIAAIQNNNSGISGTAPGCMILPLKISSGTSDLFEAASVAEAIVYAADYGVKIINLSLGWSDEEPQVIADAINYAVQKGYCLLPQQAMFMVVRFTSLLTMRMLLQFRQRIRMMLMYLQLLDLSLIWFPQEV